MGTPQPVANLRGYICQNPPGVTFFICLLTLSLSFIGLSSYGRTHILPNPDTTEDWNHILSALSQFQLCTNSAATPQYTSTPAAAQLLPEDKTTGVPSSDPPQSPPQATPLHLRVPLTVTHTSPQRPEFGIRTSLMASQLGLTGNETVNLTLELVSDPEENATYTCLSLEAPAHLLPRAPLPPECPINGRDTLIGHIVSVETSHPSTLAHQTCYSLQSQHDSSLTVMLTQEQQSVAGRHLLEVGVCLGAVCVLLWLSACLTSSQRRQNANGLDLQTEPLMGS